MIDRVISLFEVRQDDIDVTTFFYDYRYYIECKIMLLVDVSDITDLKLHYVVPQLKYDS